MRRAAVLGGLSPSYLHATEWAFGDDRSSNRGVYGPSVGKLRALALGAYGVDLRELVELVERVTLAAQRAGFRVAPVGKKGRGEELHAAQVMGWVITHGKASPEKPPRPVIGDEMAKFLMISRA